MNLFQAFVDVCDANGAGFVDYRWPKPRPGRSGFTPDVPKLAFVKQVSEWEDSPDVFANERLYPSLRRHAVFLNVMDKMAATRGEEQPDARALAFAAAKDELIAERASGLGSAGKPWTQAYRKP